MGEKDTLEKKLLYFNDVFADIVNETVFNGEAIIKEEGLQRFHGDFKVLADFIKNGENFKTKEQILDHPEEIGDLIEVLSKGSEFGTIKEKSSSTTKLTHQEQERSYSNMETLISVLNKRARAEGREEGKEEAKVKIVKAMKEKKTDISFIVDVTGLSREEVEAI